MLFWSGRAFVLFRRMKGIQGRPPPKRFDAKPSAFPVRRLCRLWPRSLCFSCLRQLAQQRHRQPNRIGDALNLRCFFTTRGFDFHHPIFNRIRSVNSAVVKSSRNLYPVSRLRHGASPAHTLSLIEAAPGVHPARARRIAANIAKLPELLRKP